MLNLIGHRSPMMMLSYVHAKLCTKALPPRAELRTLDFTPLSLLAWERYKGQPAPPRQAPPSVILPACSGTEAGPASERTSEELTLLPDSPYLLQAQEPGSGQHASQPQGQKGSAALCLPSQKSQLGLEADGCLSLASILLPSGWWQAVGTTFPGLIPEYFSAHRKFFITFPSL